MILFYFVLYFNSFQKFTSNWLNKQKTKATALYVQVVKGSEILEVLYGLPDIREYLFSLYECKYEQFFSHLGKLY